MIGNANAARKQLPNFAMFRSGTQRVKKASSKKKCIRVAVILCAMGASLTAKQH
jgi:hypothetical protein